jgi:hypothetical protein
MKEKNSCRKKENKDCNQIPYLNCSWMKGVGACVDFALSTGNQATTLWFELTVVPSLEKK